MSILVFSKGRIKVHKNLFCDVHKNLFCDVASITIDGKVERMTPEDIRCLSGALASPRNRIRPLVSRLREIDRELMFGD